MSEAVPNWCRLGFFIDAKDSMNDWCVAQVTEICEIKKTITVFHDGWGTKTTSYPFRSSKIAPFRKNTIKYTGPKRIASRNWEISDPELQENQHQVTLLLSSNLHHDDAFFITQFLRGKLFIFIENLLACNYHLHKTFLVPVVKFFGSVVHLIVLWLRRAPELFPFYYKSLGNPELYLEDSNTALALTWYELMDTLNKLFALDPRVSDFFQVYDMVPDDYEATPLTLMNDKKYSVTLMYIINLFTKEQGFEAVIQILKENDEQKRVPFPFIATTLLYVLGHFVNQDFWTRFNADMTAAVYQRIDIISETELKELKHEDIIKVLGMIRDSSENIDLKKLDFFLRMVKSNYFEKRIKGLSEINTVIENLDKRIEGVKSRISREELKNWLLKSKLLELVVNDRPNVELIKRSSGVYKFLAQCKALSLSDLESLWKSTEGRHETYIRGTYSAILEFAAYLTEDHHDFLYSKIKSVDVRNYDENFLNMVKDFTATALNAAIRYALSNRKECSKVYGLELLESLMLDSSPVDFCKLACKSIGSILSHALASKLRTQYIKKLIGMLLSNDSVPQCLMLLIKLIKGIRDSKRQAGEIKALDDEFHLIDVIVRNLKTYLDKSRRDPHDLSGSRFSHEENLMIRLKFIEFVLYCSSNVESLTEDHVQELWEMLGESSFEQEANLFYKWITKGIRRKPSLDSSIVEYIFKSILLDDKKFPISQVNEESFACFKFIFLNYHYNEENIEIVNNKFKFRRAKLLQGFEKLIQIQLKSLKVSEEAAKLIIPLLLRYSTQQINIAQIIQEEFIDSLLVILLQNKNNDLLVTRGLNLLKMLLSDVENEDFIANTYVYVHEALSREYYKIYYDQYKTMRHLRKEIAKHYRKPIESTQLQVNDKKYSGIDDDMELKSFKAHCIAVEFKYLEYKEHNPLPGLSMNQKLIKALFELLTNTEKTYTDVAWSLLVSLPANQQLEESFETLDQPIEKMLDQTSIHRLLYELMIIQKLSVDRIWNQRFMKSKGLEFLLEIFYNEPSGTHAAMRQESLIKTIANFLSRTAIIDDLPKFTHVLFSSLLQIVKSPEKVKDCESLAKAIEEVLKFIMERDGEVVKNYMAEKPQVILNVFSEILLGKPKPGLSSNLRIQFQKMVNSAEIIEIYFTLMFSLRTQALENSNENFWKLLAPIMKSIEGHEKERKMIVTELVDFVKNAAFERSSNDKNNSLCGALTVLSKAWTSTMRVSKRHMDLFLGKCLFEIPETLDRASLVPPICKHPETRSCAFELVLELCKISSKFLARVVKDLDRYHEEPDWRGSRRPEWSISAVSKEKSQSGLVGIKNLGSTCYMNSLLQQIFMVKSFRAGILAMKMQEQVDSILYQLQYLFSLLQYSDMQYINPKSFTATIKDFDGNPINVNEQMDVDEFFNYFMDKLEARLKDTETPNLIKMHFGGLQVTELIGKDCIHRSERYEPFLTVSVDVKNKKSLQEGLESFVAGEILEGENAYQCDHCEAKVRAVRRVCIKHLPNLLIIALRRFEFDFDSMNRVKLNDLCEFPLEIDMEPYTQEGLDRLDKEKAKKHPDDYYSYKLKGIVIHAGTAESGHYYSYIQDSNQKWFEFNDIIVKEFDPADIPQECYGGEEKFSWSSALTNSQNTGIREKCGNAYLLFYERSGIYSVRNSDEEALEISSLTVKTPAQASHMKTIRNQNKKYWRNRNIFAYEYSRFINGLAKIENMPFKFIMKFMLTILLRTKEKREELIFIYMRLEDEIKSNKENAKWVLELICVESVCKELLLYCPFMMMRKIVVGLVKTALETVDRESYEPNMVKLLNLLPYAKKQFTKNYAEYLEVLKLSVLACEDVLDKYKAVNIIIKYVFGKGFSLPERPKDTEPDVFLGYDNCKIIEKTEFYNTESKSTSLEHLFQLLSLIPHKIPEKYSNRLKTGEYMEQILKCADTKLAIKSISKLYSYLMSFDQSSYKIYIKKVIEYSQIQEFYKKSQVCKLFTQLLFRKSEIQAEIICFFLDCKYKQMRASKLYQDIESDIGYILNLCMKSREIQGVLREQTEILNWMEKWMKENINYGFSTGKASHFEETGRPLIKAMYLKCQKIMKNEDVYSPDIWNSDEEIDEEKLQRNKYIDVSEGNSHWVKGFIKERIGDLLYVKIRTWENNEYYTLKETYGEDIAPPGHYTSKSNYS